MQLSVGATWQPGFSQFDERPAAMRIPADGQTYPRPLIQWLVMLRQPTQLVCRIRHGTWVFVVFFFKPIKGLYSFNVKPLKMVQVGDNEDNWQLYYFHLFSFRNCCKSALNIRIIYLLKALMKVWSFEIRGFFMRLFYCSTGVLGRLVEQSSLKWTLFPCFSAQESAGPIARPYSVCREPLEREKRI